MLINLTDDVSCALEQAGSKRDRDWDSLGHPVLDRLEDEGGVLVEVRLDRGVADPGEVTLARSVDAETRGDVEHVG